MATKRNGKIELLRMVFCITVILYHISKDIYKNKLFFGEYFSFFNNGYIAVEFFFLLSGFFLAKTALKPKGENHSLGGETVTFMKNKVLGILSPHIICFTLTFILICFTDKVSFIQFFSYLFRALPAFFLLTRTGMPYLEVMSVEWYINAMLFAMLLVYPLCRKFGKTFTNIISPIVALTIIGYSLNKFGHIDGNSQWDVICCQGTMRAVCDLSLGATCYAITQKLKTLNFSKTGKIILTIVEVFCFVIAIFGIVLRFDRKWNSVMLLLLFAGISICMANITYYPKFFDSKIISFAGKASLPIYLAQNFARDFVEAYITSVPKKFQTLLILAISIVLGLIVMQVSKPLDKAIRNKLNNLNLRDKTYIPKFSKNNQD